MNNPLSWLAGAIALGLPLLVAAQARGSDPTQAKQTTPPLRYDSAFADYKPWQDTKPSDWRGVNDALLKDVPGVAVLGDAEEDASCAETLDDSEEDVSGAGVEDPDEHDVSSSTSMASSASTRPVEYADPETDDINFPIQIAARLGR